MSWNTLFDPENSFWSFMNKLADLCFLSVLWLLFSLPVVTCGAATVALYHFTLRQVDDSEGYAFRSFWKAFREDFKSSTLLWLLTLACAFVLYLDFIAIGTIAIAQMLRIAFYSVALCLGVLYAMMVLYAFPLLSLYRIPLKKAIKDGFVMAFQHLPSTLLSFLVFAFFFWASFKLPYLAFLFFPLALFITSYVMRHVFSSYQE